MGQMSDNPSFGVLKRYELQLLAVFLACTGFSYIGLQWAALADVGAPIWPASGVGLAALLLGRLSLWPAIALGHLTAAILFGSRQPLWAEAVIGIGGALGAVVPVLVIRRLGGINNNLRSLTDITRFLLPGAGLGAIVSSVVVSVALWGSAGLNARSFIMAFAHITVGNFVGALTMGPLLLSWAAGFRSFPPRRLLGLGAVLLITAALAFGMFRTYDSALLSWDLLPLLVFTALAFDVRGASLTLVVVSGIAISAQSVGLGPFAVSQGPQAWQVFLLQQFIATIAVTTLVVSVVSDERRAKEAMRQSESRASAAEEQARITAEELRTVLDSVPAIIWVARDPECRQIVGNQFASQFLRVPSPSANMSKSANDAAPVAHFKVLNTQGRELTPDELPVQRAARGEVVSGYEECVLFDDGTRRDLLGGATPLYSASGEVRGAVAAFIDITERRAAEARERLLSREVDHRAKNVMAIVQAVVQLTKAEDIEGFRKAVLGRIASLARTHSLLAKNRWDGAELHKLVQDELAPYAQEQDAGGLRIQTGGPVIKLAPENAQSLALVLHELATNAVKYGALSVPSGALSVTWRVEDHAEGQRLHFRWTENGGPEAATPQRQGFGLTLIRSTAEQQLHGQLQAQWLQGGLDLAISFPHDQPSVSHVPHHPATGEGQSPAKTPRLAAPRVLVLEDETLIAMQVEQHLQDAGYDVLGPAANVAEALELLERERPDAALLDMNLRGEKSTSVADALHGLGIPFLFCTGFADTEDLPPRLQSAKSLIKPIAPQELVEALCSLLAQPEHVDP
ncbi:response regulator [Novosphingobium umbonatum]|uniref:histidine kinase n=1 Tax=Novosphingobium umbonatum TaxID=1908524 RepID=A0A3S2UV26_9SPHN|nr:MASE1 domain-containing protein [Novosphingobium umbonatum]RVU05799.1 response regulator [Novosphingobium umbonatum]